MVRQDHPIDTLTGKPDGVIDILNSLDQEFAAPGFTQPAHIIHRDGRIKDVVDQIRHSAIR